MRMGRIAFVILIVLSSAYTVEAKLNEFSVADGYQDPFFTRVWTYNSLWSFDGGTIGSNYVAQHGYAGGFPFGEPFALVIRNDSQPDSYRFSYNFESSDLNGLNPSLITAGKLTMSFDVCSTVNQNSSTADGVAMLTMGFGGTATTPGLQLGFSDSNYLMYSDSSGNLTEFTGLTLNAMGWDRVELTMDFDANTYDLSVTNLVGSGASSSLALGTTYNIVSGQGFITPLAALENLWFETNTDPEDGDNMGWHKMFLDNFDAVRSADARPVPEPSTLAMFAIFGMIFYGWRRRTK